MKKILQNIKKQIGSPAPVSSLNEARPTRDVADIFPEYPEIGYLKY